MKNGTSKLKYWHEKYPTRFGVIFLLLYGMLDVADARWFIPLRAKIPVEVVNGLLYLLHQNKTNRPQSLK